MQPLDSGTGYVRKRPAMSATSPQKRTGRGLRALRGSSTILVVDDDTMVRTLLETLLEIAGYRVVSAECAAEAMRAANQASGGGFDMLVTDFQMPGMDGVELARLMTDSRPALPVLLVSGTAPKMLPLSEVARRHWSYLAKPVDPLELVRTVDAHCLGDRSLQGIERVAS